MQRDPRPSSRTAQRASTALPLALALLGAACHHHHHGDDDGRDDGSHGGPDVFDEREPNGTADNADWIGGFDTRSHIVIRGTIDEGGPDLYDGFAFEAREPVTVDFSLYGYAFGADLDVAVYDPFIDEFVDFWESPENPEQGAFVVLDAGQEFHLVLNSFSRDSAYDLELWGSPAALGPGEPGTRASRGAIRRDGLQPRRETPGRDVRRFEGYSPAAPRPAIQPSHPPLLLLEYDGFGRLIDASAWRPEPAAARPQAIRENRPGSLW